MQLVLSLFPGIDLLGSAFKDAGFSVVQSGDPIFGGDIRDEHWPAGRFQGVIGGPPCQAFSRLAHMVRHNGYEPKFGNLIPEFERAVREAEPDWFLMEEVKDAPCPVVDGYEVHSFCVNNRQFGEKQNRVRRISFGYRGERRPLMLDVVVFEHQDFEYAACGGGQSVPIAVDGSGKENPALRKHQRLNSAVGFNVKSESSFRRLCELQGLPPDFDLPGFTVTAKCKAVGNGVPRAMGLALAKATLEATGRK